MDALAFLKVKVPKLQPFYALVGDEDFLKRHVRARIIDIALGDDDPAFAVSVYSGEKIEFSTARNDLETPAFLAPCRIVVIENADTFVTSYRAELEAYALKPSPVGVLVLDVKTFPETTKLAKALPEAAKIACKAPSANRAYELKPWCIDWAKSTYGKKLNADAAELLLELVGAEMGLLDQELSKLAIAVGDRPEIAVEDVDRLVSRSKSADVFRILDTIGDGKPDEALSILEELFADGEAAMAILGPLTAQLRKLAMAGRLIRDERQSLGQALDAAGVPKWPRARESTERQLRHLGRRRLDKLIDWLVTINLGVKGGNPLPERVQVERLIVMLARPRES